MPDQQDITPDVSVRTARRDDAAAVGHVQAALWRWAYAEILPAEVLAECTPEAFEQEWTRSLEQAPTPRHRLLVATEAGPVIGFVAVGPSQDDLDIGEILVGGVLPDVRRHGHGSRLLNAAIDTLRAGDLTQVHLWLPAGDAETRAFLQGAGFAPDGAYRERVVSDVDAMREVRLVADAAEG